MRQGTIIPGVRGTGVRRTMRKNVKTPLKTLNKEILGDTFILLRTVPSPPAL